MSFSGKIAIIASNITNENYELYRMRFQRRMIIMENVTSLTINNDAPIGAYRINAK